MTASFGFLSGALSVLFPTWSAPGVFRTKARARSYICTPLDQRKGAEQHPDVLEAPHPRGAYFSQSLEVCSERVLRDGLRDARDEVVLAHLNEQAAAIVQAVTGTRPDLAERTFLVEAHYPGHAVAPKLRFATQNALMSAGLAVSDRRPTLTTQDVVVLSQLAPDAAYAGACERYAALGSLHDNDALVAVLVRDSRQTDLQAGVCADGRWVWVR
jgi:hypothetical protein